jgi:hypothetical protein
MPLPLQGHFYLTSLDDLAGRNICNKYANNITATAPITFSHKKEMIFR